MAISYDSEKDRANQEKHGISLARAEEMRIAAVLDDTRRDYGETRLRAFGHIDGTAYCLAFTVRNGEVRAISLRRAREKEMKRYVSQTPNPDR
jgi:uncharacterized protein